MVEVIPGDRVLGMGQVIEKVHFSRRKVYMMLQKGEFPQPTKFGKATRWRESVIDQWIADTMDGGNERHQAVIVANPYSGGKQSICPSCQLPGDIVESGGPIFIAQPNRQAYATATGYQRAAKARFRCARCKTPFEAA